ncbi:MFS transporter [Amycolatopsis sp. GM8]|uniref:MFS transporter n=1 Tax=Amycolatopsis sp. GM8 TaxID=2896530 RepID=UPI001F03150A|nr:MFS transporter [Amycolatopsis sp. GM8]
MARVPTGADSLTASATTHPRRQMLSLAAVGNVFEWFDFTVYGFFAPQIAATFFPSTNPLTGLLSTFLVFVIGFLARPIGGLFFGRLVDRIGRKSVMLTSMLLMAAGALLIGIAPGYATAGALGGIVVVIGRLCQGLSAGGEQGSSGMFLVEWAGPGRRAFYGSFLNSVATTGVLMGALFGALLTTTLGKETVTAWAWRIPFFVGAALALVVLFLRRSLEETPVFREVQAAHKSVQKAEADAEKTTKATNRMGNGGVFIVVIGLCALWATTTFITLVFTPTFAFSIVGVKASGSLWAVVVGAALTSLLIPFGGDISDRIGRRPAIFFSAIGYLVLALPLFALITTTKAFWAVLLLEVVMAFFSAPILGVGVATIVELFTGRHHGLLVSFSMAVGVTIFGGFGPYICTWLIKVTGQPLSICYWILFVSLLTLVATFFIPRDLHKRELGQ